MCSMQPLADLYIILLSDGKCLSLIIIPSISNDAALLIIEPIFLGSVTSSKHAKVKSFLILINSFDDGMGYLQPSKLILCLDIDMFDR